MADEEKKDMPFITKVLIVAILAVVIIILAAGISYFVASKAIKSNSVAQLENGGKSKNTKKNKDRGVSGPIVDFGEFTVNLNEKDTRYLVCKIQFEIDPTGKDKGKNGQTEIPEKLVILQDRVLTILRSKSIMDLAQDPSLKSLKKEIIIAVNKILEKSKIKNVYFTNWIIQ